MTDWTFQTHLGQYPSQTTQRLALGPGMPSSPFGPGSPGKPYKHKVKKLRYTREKTTLIWSSTTMACEMFVEAHLTPRPSNISFSPSCSRWALIMTKREGLNLFQMLLDLLGRSSVVVPLCPLQLFPVDQRDQECQNRPQGPVYQVGPPLPGEMQKRNKKRNKWQYIHI